MTLVGLDVGTTGDPDFATTAAGAQEAGLGIPTNAASTYTDRITTATRSSGRRYDVIAGATTSAQKAASPNTPRHAPTR